MQPTLMIKTEGWYLRHSVFASIAANIDDKDLWGWCSMLVIPKPGKDFLKYLQSLTNISHCKWHFSQNDSGNLEGHRTFES